MRLKGAATAIGSAAIVLLTGLANFPSTLPDDELGASSIPDLTAIWHRKGSLAGRPNPAVMPTEIAARFEMAFDDALNPTYDCSPTPVPGLINDDYDFQIVQQPDRVIIRYEKMDVVRTIWLEGHGHPNPGPNDYTNQGHSIGRYQQGRLVVETTMFSIDPRGFHSLRWVPSTPKKRMTERYWRVGDVLRMESLTEDPLVLEEPFRYDYEWTTRQEDLIPYDCDPADSRWGSQWHESKYLADE